MKNSSFRNKPWFTTEHRALLLFAALKFGQTHKLIKNLLKKGCVNVDVKNYYVSGNTAQGFVNLLSSNVSQFEHTVILKHPSEKLKTAVLKNFFDLYKDQFTMEVLLSPLGGNYLDGIIIREKAFAIIIDRVSTAELSGAIELDLDLFIKHETEVHENAKNKFQSYTEQAYESFAEGLRIHDDLEKIYINEMDFACADQLADQFIKEVLKSSKKRDRQAHESRRLFGTNTPEGAVNVVPEIIQSISNVYYLKGRAGTGKSTFMKKIAAACKEYGFDIERYYCSFDPDSIDMIHVPDLDFCIFDSTDPHEFFPTRNGERIIDLYEEAVTPGTDEKFADEIQSTKAHYKSFMKKGIKNLKEADRYLAAYEKLFSFTQLEIDKITKFVQKSIVQ